MAESTSKFHPTAFDCTRSPAGTSIYPPKDAPRSPGQRWQAHRSPRYTHSSDYSHNQQRTYPAAASYNLIALSLQLVHQTLIDCCGKQLLALLSGRRWCSHPTEPGLSVRVRPGGPSRETKAPRQTGSWLGRSAHTATLTSMPTWGGTHTVSRCSKRHFFALFLSLHRFRRRTETDEDHQTERKKQKSKSKTEHVFAMCEESIRAQTLATATLGGTAYLSRPTHEGIGGIGAGVAHVGGVQGIAAIVIPAGPATAIRTRHPLGAGVADIVVPRGVAVAQVEEVLPFKHRLRVLPSRNKGETGQGAGASVTFRRCVEVCCLHRPCTPHTA